MALVLESMTRYEDKYLTSDPDPTADVTRRRRLIDAVAPRARCGAGNRKGASDMATTDACLDAPSRNASRPRLILMLALQAPSRCSGGTARAAHAAAIGARGACGQRPAHARRHRGRGRAGGAGDRPCGRAAGRRAGDFVVTRRRRHDHRRAGHLRRGGRRHARRLDARRTPARTRSPRAGRPASLRSSSARSPWTCAALLQPYVLASSAAGTLATTDCRLSFGAYLDSYAVSLAAGSSVRFNHDLDRGGRAAHARHTDSTRSR
jgi:hypothetical protein